MFSQDLSHLNPDVVLTSSVPPRREVIKHAHLSCLRFQALYNYAPRNEDELELRESDVVDVTEKCDDGWFVGTCSLILRHI